MSDDEIDSLLRKVGRAPPRPLDARFVDHRYELGALVGEGSFGTVYDAFDRRRGERVALKVLRRANSEALLRFKREFRTLARLSDRGLVRLYDLHGAGDHWYFTMERIDGVPFDVWVREPARLRGALDELSRTLSSLHAHGYVHRDIKPSNVLVERDGRVVVLDFGLVHAHEEAQSTVIAGTPVYVAPEVAAGARPTPAADWYAVGVMLFEALTGETPFEGSADDVVRSKRTQRVPPVLSRAPSAPQDLAALCDALLDPRPEARPIPSVTAPARPFAPPFIGRHAELTALERALAARTPVVRVAGASGVGKSTVVGRLVERSRERGAHVLATRCDPRDHTAFVALDGLVDELARKLARLPPARTRAIAPRDAAALVQSFPVLRAVPGFDGGRPRSDARSRVGTALAELLSRWGDAVAWVVVIDDAQWGDADSAAVLREVLREAEVPLTVVLVHRAEGSSPLLRELGKGAPTIAIEGLPESDARVLACEAGARERIDALVAESQGHPMFLVELVRDRLRGGEERSLEDILRARVDALTPDAQKAARLAAVAGAPIATAALRAAGIPLPAIEELTAAGLLGFVDADSVALVHDRVREAICDALGASEARALHGTLARAILDVSPERGGALAFHFGEAGQHLEAATHLLRAARAATASRAFAQARAHYARLFAARERASVDDGLDLALRIESAEASARAGRLVEAADALLAASRLAAPDEALHWRVRAAEQLLSAGRIERGERILDEQLDGLGLSLPSSTPGRVLGVMRDSVGRRLDRLRPRRTSEARLVALWSAVKGAMLVSPVRAVAMGSCLVREAAKPGATAHARMAAAFVDSLGAVGPRGPEALPRALSRIAAELTDDADPRVAQLHAMAKGVLEATGLSFRSSIASLERAVRIGVEHGLGHGWEEAMSRAVQGSSAWVLGDVAYLRAYLPSLCAELDERDHLLAWMLSSLHHAWLVFIEHGPDAAEPEVEEIGRRWTSRGRELQGWWLDIGRIQFAMARGDARTAWTLSRPQARPYQERIFSTLMHRLEAQTFLVRAAIMLARDGRAGTGETAKARKAVAQIESVPGAWTRAHGHCLRAGLASVTGDLEGAVAGLRAALPAFDEERMPLYRALAEDALGTLLSGDGGRAQVARAREQLRAWRVDRDVAMASMLPGAW